MANAVFPLLHASARFADCMPAPSYLGLYSDHIALTTPSQPTVGGPHAWVDFFGFTETILKITGRCYGAAGGTSTSQRKRRPYGTSHSFLLGQLLTVDLAPWLSRALGCRVPGRPAKSFLNPRSR